LSGILWSIGNILSAQAVKDSGLSRSAPVWMGVGIFIAFSWGILFFKEALTSLLIGVVGIVLLSFGISLISSTTEDNKSSNLRGIILAILAGLVFGSYFVPFDCVSRAISMLPLCLNPNPNRDCITWQARCVVCRIKCVGKQFGLNNHIITRWLLKDMSYSLFDNLDNTFNLIVSAFKANRSNSTVHLN